MPLPILSGPFVLSVGAVEEAIRGKISGVYVLSTKAGGDINCRRVGRADDDLGMTIKDFVGLYSHFSYASALSPAQAYAMECEFYHSGKLPENPAHPMKPAGCHWICPVCRQ